MAFLQRFRTCDSHDACHLIDCVTDADIADKANGNVIHEAGAVVWESHAPDHTHPECRANPDHPLQGGDSTKQMCEHCQAHFEVV